MSNNLYVESMSNADYHANSAISKSTLDMASKDLFRPSWSKLCPQDQDKIKTFDFGDAMHAICLEPDRLKSEFLIMPDFNLRTNEGKASKELFIKESEGKKILTDSEHKQLNLMFESIMSYLPARTIIESEGAAEGSYFWTDEETGLKCKCRPDKDLLKSRLLIDVKTTPELKKFCYSVDDFRYHVQNAWYCDGVSRFRDDPVSMEFLVIQKTIEIGRYPVMLVKLPDEIIEYGRALYKEDLRNYANFLNLGIPPETRELEVHYNFLNKAMEKITEVNI